MSDHPGFSEPEEIVRAIRQGEVDAFVVTERGAETIYSLRTADLLYRTMIEEMKEGAVALDPDGVIIYSNGHFSRMIRLDRSLILGRSIFAFLPDESRSFFEDLRSQAANQTSRAEIAVRSNEGLEVPVHATMNRMKLEDSDVFCLILTDLRDQRHREELLIGNRRKDEFLAMLAHELRNPIAPIRTAAHILGLKANGDPQLQWIREVIERQASHLNRLVDDLLDVARISAGKIRVTFETVDLARIARETAEACRPAFEGRKQQFAVEVPDMPVLIEGDTVRLSQVISNLLTNASKFTPENGKVCLEVQEKGGRAEIVVSDTGLGIAPEMLSKIFDLFAQADSSSKRRQGGLGIGLTLVRRLVEMHGGDVEARSEGEGTGSAFIVRLPLKEKPPAGPSRGEPSAAESPHGVPRRILVVDDNVDVAESLTMLLEMYGHDVRNVRDGQGAIAVGRAFRPEVVLLDIGMPGMNGYEIARALRAIPELEHTVLVALTGYAQEEDRRRSEEAGFDRHWTKPLDQEALADLLRSLPERA